MDKDAQASNGGPAHQHGDQVVGLGIFHGFGQVEPPGLQHQALLWDYQPPRPVVLLRVQDSLLVGHQLGGQPQVVAIWPQPGLIPIADDDVARLPLEFDFIAG